MRLSSGLAYSRTASWRPRAARTRIRCWALLRAIVSTPLRRADACRFTRPLLPLHRCAASGPPSTTEQGGSAGIPAPASGTLAARGAGGMGRGDPYENVVAIMRRSVTQISKVISLSPPQLPQSMLEFSGVTAVGTCVTYIVSRGGSIGARCCRSSRGRCTSKLPNSRSAAALPTSVLRALPMSEPLPTRPPTSCGRSGLQVGRVVVCALAWSHTARSVMSAATPGARTELACGHPTTARILLARACNDAPAKVCVAPVVPCALHSLLPTPPSPAHLAATRHAACLPDARGGPYRARAPRGEPPPSRRCPPHPASRTRRSAP